MIRSEPTAQLRKKGYHYSVLPTEIVRDITNPDALAILTYLNSHAGNWEVRRTQVMKHFALGRDRYNAAIKHLIKKKLYSKSVVRDVRGRIVDNVIEISNVPIDDWGESTECPKTAHPVEGSTEYTENGHSVPNVRKPHGRENPTVGKSDPLSSNQGIKYLSIEEEGRNTSTNDASEYSAYEPDQMTLDAIKKMGTVLEDSWVAQFRVYAMGREIPLKQLGKSFINWIKYERVSSANLKDQESENQDLIHLRRMDPGKLAELARTKYGINTAGIGTAEEIIQKILKKKTRLTKEVA